MSETIPPLSGTEEFACKVSVIVPVFNAEPFLRGCVDSLLSQTVEKSAVEILLMDDGSTDGSLEICREYAHSHLNIRVFTRENRGLSATRNDGIRRARGKYLMYLDADDTLAPETVRAVTEFFDSCGDRVDLVTYPDQPYRAGKKLPRHYRYKELRESGVYSLEDHPYLCQTRINICVKNRGKANILFDETPGFRHEDQKYNPLILREKGALGYCAEGEYRYNRGNESSIMTLNSHAICLFETSTAYYESMVELFGGSPPRYIQALLLSELNWKLKENCLYPHHYEGERWEAAVARIRRLLAAIGEDIILEHPAVNNFHRHYWLQMKPGVSPTVLARRDSVSVWLGAKRIYHRRRMEIILHKIWVEPGGERFGVSAFVKMPIYNHLPDPAEVWVVEDDGRQRKKLEVYLSAHSCLESRTRTNRFYAFRYDGGCGRVSSFRFVVTLDGVDYDANYWFMPGSGFENGAGRKSIIRGTHKIQHKDDTFTLTALSEPEIQRHRLAASEPYRATDPQLFRIRAESLEYRKHHRVWLYSDWHTVTKDNAYYQFLNDFAHPEDGVERYYVYTREYGEIRDLFRPEHRDYLVRFGSEKHKILCLSAEKILSAFFGVSPIIPWKEPEWQKLCDLFEAQVIYLQHGVLHADLRTVNTAERRKADRVVISSPFERENLIKNYHYREEELFPSGMARFDCLDTAAEPQKKILFAPSWRSYLTASPADSVWELRPAALTESAYYRKFKAFLESPALAALLEKHGMELRFKPHPILAETEGLFEINSPRVTVSAEDVRQEDYAVFITDFSSFAFDFVYLRRPMLYFLPDDEEFRSGMNSYRKLDLPFEEAFGDLVYTPEAAVEKLAEILENGAAPSEKYRERMERFFLPGRHHCERTYRLVIGE